MNKMEKINQKETDMTSESGNSGVFLLALKRKGGTSYCIGVHRLGTPGMEFILGETDNDRDYRAGDEVSYIYNAEYTGILADAVSWLQKAGSP